MNSLARLLAWAAWAPPLLALCWTVWLRAVIPEPMLWTSRRGASPVPLDLWGLLQVRDAPHYFLEEIWAWAVHRLPGLSFADLSLLSWCLALLFWRLALGILRRGTAGEPHWAWQVLLSAWVFHPQWGATWLLGERATAFLPGVFFLLAVRALLRPRPGKGADYQALLLVCCAQASGPQGLCAGLALLPMVAARARAAGSLRVRPAVLSFGLVVVLWQLLICYGLREDWTRSGLVGMAVEQRELLRGFIKGLLKAGPSLGLLVAVAGLVALGLLAMAFALLYGGEREGALEPADGLGLALLLYGLGAGLVLTEQFAVVHSAAESGAELWESGQFLPCLGVGGLLLLRRHWPRLHAELWPLLLGGLVLLSLQSWGAGQRFLRTQALALQRETGLLLLDEMAGGELLPSLGQGQNMPHLILPLAELRAGRERGKFVGLDPLTSMDLSSPEYPEPETMQGSFLLEDGVLRGAELRGSFFRPVPALVLLVEAKGGALRCCGLLRTRLDGSLRRAEAIVQLPPDFGGGAEARLRAFGLHYGPLRLRELPDVLRRVDGVWLREASK